MLNSLGGFFLIVLAGICWIGIGVTVSKSSAKKWDYNIIQGLNYAGTVLFCIAAFFCFFHDRKIAEIFSFPLLMSCIGGFANFFTYVFTARAMQKGPNGLVWGIMQSGMIGSFLMGILCFGEKATVLRLTGLFLISGGVLLMGIAKDPASSGKEQNKKWLLFSLAAFGFVIITHCCNAIPSYFPHLAPGNTGTEKAQDMGLLLRTFGAAFGAFLGFTLTTLPGMIRERKTGNKGEWITAGVLMCLNTISGLFFFYRGLNLLAQQGCGGLGYPVAIGVCVTGFSLYSIFFLKEKFASVGFFGLAGVCGGIVMIALR